VRAIGLKDTLQTFSEQYRKMFRILSEAGRAKIDLVVNEETGRLIVPTP
jgi:hypothetical protein